jgi:hypothetical protein
MALAIVLLSHISAIAQQKVELKYDRIQLAEGFRNELYPELGPHRLINGWVGNTFFYVGITPCRLGSDVVSPSKNRAKDLPKQCPGPMQADASSVFMASIELGDMKPFLRGHGAGGRVPKRKSRSMAQGNHHAPRVGGRRHAECPTPNESAFRSNREGCICSNDSGPTHRALFWLS